uniref:7TM GPCR serpentine receptor class x (Srx) domain-containing protein n=1 Tax=Panagrellus redivivus TaxID=6233 RepID=A0A7E4ZS17_PANRE
MTQWHLDNDELWYIAIWSSVYNMSFELVYATDALMLLLISKNIRKTFLKFLHFDKLAKLWQCIRHKDGQIQQIPSVVVTVV